MEIINIRRKSAALNDTDAELENQRPQHRNSPTFLDKASHYASSSIRVDKFMDLQLLLLTFSTGVQDAISFPDFRCFSSNQTGNTVVLAVDLAGSAGEQIFHLPNVIVSLSTFIANATITGQIGNWIGPRNRTWQFFANMASIVMVFGAACIQFSHGTHASGSWALGSIALLAISSGCQVAAARAIQVPEITTAMATAAWFDLVIDPTLLAGRNHSRDRRALFLACLVAGSFAGAYTHSRISGIGSPIALVVSAAGKLLVTIMILFSRPELSGRKRSSIEAGSHT